MNSTTSLIRLAGRALPPRRSLPRSRRSFTLLEVMLASIIGGMVTLGCVAMMSSLDRGQATAAARVDTRRQFALVHSTMQRAMRSIVMAEGSRFRPGQRPGGAGAGGGGGGGGAATESTMVQPNSTPTQEPRMRIEFDTSDPVKPRKRFEVVLSDSPVFVPPMYRNAAAVRAEESALAAPAQAPTSSASSSPSSASANSSSTGDASSTTNAQGASSASSTISSRSRTPPRPSALIAQDSPGTTIRGAFELEPDSPGDPDTSYTLWWRRLSDTIPTLPDGTRPRGTPLESFPLVRNVVRCNWYPRYISRPQDQAEPDTAQLTTRDDIPAYLIMQLATRDGQSAQWLFELSFITGVDAGQTESTVTVGRGDGGGGGGGQRAFFENMSEEERQKFREQFRNMTDEERRAFFEQRRRERENADRTVRFDVQVAGEALRLQGAQRLDGEFRVRFDERSGPDGEGRFIFREAPPENPDAPTPPGQRNRGGRGRGANNPGSGNRGGGGQ